MERREIPWWLWPNLISLDAPLVAVAWLWIFARQWDAGGLHPGVALLLAATVWIIYIADRWHDTRRRDAGMLSARHQFHRAHGGVLLTLGVLACAACLIFFSAAIPHARIWFVPDGSGGWSGLAAGPGLLVLAGCAAFAALARVPGRSRIWRHSKNLTAACTFALGTALGAYGASAIDAASPAVVSAVVGFASLCLMNLIAIDAWEAEKRRGVAAPGTTSSLILPVAVILPASLICGTTSSDWSFPLALWIAAAGLWRVDAHRAGLSAPALRVLADVALVVPLPVIEWIRWQW